MLALFLLVAGAVAVVAGAFLISVPVGVIAAGLVTLAVGYDLTPDEPTS